MFASSHGTAMFSCGICLVVAAGAALARARRTSTLWRRGYERRQWLEYAAQAERSAQEWARRRG